MKTLYLVTIIILSLSVSNCSVLENTFYLKKYDKTNGWSRIKDNTYTPYYSFYQNVYYKSIGTDSIFIGVSTNSKMLFIGPPLIPVIPIFFINRYNNGVYVSLSIKSGNYRKYSDVLDSIHFLCNNNEILFPKIRYIMYGDTILENGIKKVTSTKDIEGSTQDLNLIRFGLEFDINPKKVKRFIIIFDDKIALKKTPLELKKKFHLHYAPFIFMAH